MISCGEKPLLSSHVASRSTTAMCVYACVDSQKADMSESECDTHARAHACPTPPPPPVNTRKHTHASTHACTRTHKNGREITHTQACTHTNVYTPGASAVLLDSSTDRPSPFPNRTPSPCSLSRPSRHSRMDFPHPPLVYRCCPKEAASLA